MIMEQNVLDNPIVLESHFPFFVRRWDKIYVDREGPIGNLIRKKKIRETGRKTGIIYTEVICPKEEDTFEIKRFWEFGAYPGLYLYPFDKKKQKEIYNKDLDILFLFQTEVEAIGRNRPISWDNTYKKLNSGIFLRTTWEPMSEYEFKNNFSMSDCYEKDELPPNEVKNIAINGALGMYPHATTPKEALKELKEIHFL